MDITISNAGGPQPGSTPAGGGADAKSVEGLQNRLKDIQSGKSDNPKEDLKNLEKDVQKAQQAEENKAGGGDDKMMEKLMQLLQMIMEMMQEDKAGDKGKKPDDKPAKPPGQ